MKQKKSRNTDRKLNIIAFDIDEAALQLNGLIIDSKKLLSDVDHHIVSDIKICKSSNKYEYEQIKRKNIMGKEEMKYPAIYGDYMKLINDIKGNINKFEKKLEKVEDLKMGDLQKLFRKQSIKERKQMQIENRKKDRERKKMKNIKKRKRQESANSVNDDDDIIVIPQQKKQKMNNEPQDEEEQDQDEDDDLQILN